MTPRDFEAFTEAQRPILMAKTAAITGSRETAADLVQDTFLRLWLQRDRLESMDAPGAFAATVARNLALDWLRAQGRHPQTPLDALAETVDSAPRPDHIVEASQAADTLQAIMTQLPPAQRSILDMRQAQGLEIAEIAKVIGSSENNVRVLLCRARAKVKQLFLLNQQ